MSLDESLAVSDLRSEDVLTELGADQSQLLVYDDTSGRPALRLDPWSGIPLRLVTGRRLTAVSEETVEVEPVWRNSRQLVRMIYTERINCAEAAKRLQQKAGAVRVTIHRIRRALQACVQSQIAEKPA